MIIDDPVFDHYYSVFAPPPVRVLFATTCAACSAPLELRGRDERDLLRFQFQAFEHGWRQVAPGRHLCPRCAGG